MSVRQVVADSAGASVAQADGSPTLIAALPRYIDAGESHTCVILDDATLKCFGSNSSGQIGSGGTAALGDAASEMGDALVAVNLGAGRTARAVATGRVHTCVLLDNASVKCFGEGDDGRLGTGATTDVGRSAASMGDALRELDLGTGRTARAITAGGAHSCAILDDHRVKCWGANDEGQLGLGDTDARGDDPGEMGDALPSVDLGLPAGVVVSGITAGDAHTCVLLSSGAVKCWGSGANGRLGLGDEQPRGIAAGEMGATLASVDLGAGRRAVALSAGAAHTCAIRDLDDVVCWGVGADGRLGIGSTTSVGISPAQMGDGLVPVPLGTGHRASAIRAGAAHTCVVAATREARCWGSGASGRLGSGDVSSLGDQPNELGDALAPIAVGTGRSARAVATGTAHTCVVLDTFDLTCFGLGSSGRLGTGSIDTIGDGPNEMGDALTAVNVGTDRRVQSLTEPGRAGTPVGTTGDGSVDLVWSAPLATGGSAITGYRVEYSSDALHWQVASDDEPTTALQISGLNNDTGYQFRVTARNAVGDGAVSMLSAVVTPTAPTTTTTTLPTTTTTMPTTTTLPIITTTTSTSTTTSTTTSTSTTTITPSTITPETITPRIITPAVRTVLVRPFPAMSATLTAQQRRQIIALARELSNERALAGRRDAVATPLPATGGPHSLAVPTPAESAGVLPAVVMCVGGAGAGPLPLLRELARLRAQAVCSLLERRLPGVQTRIDVRVGEQSATDLSRRVLVVVGSESQTNLRARAASRL